MRFVLAFAVLLLSACARRPLGSPSERWVRSIHFEGNGGPLSSTSDSALKSALVQRPSKAPGFRWLAPRRLWVDLDDDVLAKDGWRLETWYAHQGFFDAKFQGWEIEIVRPARSGKRSRPAIVTIKGHVLPGAPSVVRTVSWEGAEGVGRPIVALLDRERPLQEGNRFELDATLQTRDLALSRLRERSFAYAEVVPEIEAFPGLGVVDVRFMVSTGPPSVFGPVTIRGAKNEPARAIEDRIAVEEGEAYRDSVIGKSQRALFGLGTFSVVDITPERATGPDGPVPTIPVHVDLKESEFRTLKAGGGFAIDTGSQHVHQTTEFTHVNVLHRLYRLEALLTVGYAAFAGLDDLTWTPLAVASDVEGGPEAAAGVTFEFPDVPAHRLTSALGVELEHAREESWGTNSLAFGPTLGWSAELLGADRDKRPVQFRPTIGYQFQLFRYFDLDEYEIDSSLVVDPDETGVLSYLSQQLVVDSLDDLLNTHRGGYGVLDIHEAGGPVGGEFSYLRSTIDLRAYRSLLKLMGFEPRLVVAGRIGAGFIELYGDEAVRRVPLAERLFLGGSTTVRGWTENHLGPYSCALENPFHLPADMDASTREELEIANGYSCVTSSGEQRTDDIVAVGGLFSLFGGLEVRHYYPNGIGWAVFVDAGRVWADLTDVTLGEIAPSLGVGLRYKTVIGPIRFDVARRMNDDPMFAQEPRYGFHFALSEAY